MKRFDLIAPCHFGLEAVLKREIIDLGYEIASVEDGRVTFHGDEDAVVRANIFLRTAERVMIEVGSFTATSFEELFDKTRELPWEEYIPKNGRFWVAKASSVKSKLFSPSDIQSIMKKAMVRRLGEYYGVSWFDEDGAPYPLRVFIKNDKVTIGLDTTGDSLHKRGYRKLTAKAPIAENLAAALIMLTPWKKDRSFVDPFCGSGTFPIEAALMAANIAPGMNRTFTAESWTNIIDRKLWYSCIDEAEEQIDMSVDLDIQGYDLDPEMIRISRENAALAGVEKLIHFQQRPVSELRHPKKYGFLITNPPYGERLLDREGLPELYGQIGDAISGLDCWSSYIITSYEDVEKYIGKKADKNRKIYNGMMKTYFYQFPGPKPGKRPVAGAEVKAADGEQKKEAGRSELKYEPAIRNREERAEAEGSQKSAGNAGYNYNKREERRNASTQEKRNEQRNASSQGKRNERGNAASQGKRNERSGAPAPKREKRKWTME